MGTERTFCFVDLAGFSALTEAHGDNQAVAVLDHFSGLTQDSLTPGVELVKTIGDAVMLASANPAAMIDTVTSLVEACQGTPEFPLPRAGAHVGQAVPRPGDYLGAAVNLAARVADHAGGGQFLATAVVADAARRAGREVVAHGLHLLRNVAEPVELFDIAVGEACAPHTIDPVCRMHIDPDHATASVRHADRQYWFCSLDCVSAFATNPGRYLAMLEGT